MKKATELSTYAARRFPVGAEVTDGGTHFRVWAPERNQVDVILENRKITVPLQKDSLGYFEGFTASAHVGDLYRFRLDAKDAFGDPASRFQPESVHGPSQIIDSSAFTWTDQEWKGVSIQGQIIYEMHVGTFTEEGTWRAAISELSKLAELGITTIEVMPVAEFPGEFGWGYDGTFWFAPTRLYGTPDDFRAFVNEAHSLSMAVMLDVVYNHLGPDGNYLLQFSPHYFSQTKTEWGDAINYDGPHSESVRELIISNARYWIEEFHLDGLRLDATQQIFDRSKKHIVAELTREAREAATPRDIIVVTENETNDTMMVRSTETGGMNVDALWNDDFHHSAYVALTGFNEAYYSGFRGHPQEFISVLKYGCLYQGQYYPWQKKRRGASGLDLSPATAVTFLENHDQVSNSVAGNRLITHCHPGSYRALMTLVLLGPGTPMLFQGQEFGARTQFCYFADHHAELAKLVRNGRIQFLGQFPSLTKEETRAQIPDPGSRATFEMCKLQRSESDEHLAAFHRDLILLRKSDSTFSLQRPRAIDGAVLAENAFVIRYLNNGFDDRLLLVNLGQQYLLTAPAEPLLAPPIGKEWKLIWGSDDPKYGGEGIPPVESETGWNLPGHCALVFIAVDPGSANDA